jgi:rhodanese-related sulfurtransferase
MRKSILVLVVLLAGCSSSVSAGIQSVDAAEAQALVSEAGTVVLDIRTPDEFADGRVDGAINIDFYAADFADRIAALDRNATYVVYCRSDSRSGQAMDLFRDLGFAAVNEVDGGILSWIQAGLPVVGG